MSRYVTKAGHLEIVIGWDKMLQTYFITAYDRSRQPNEQAVLRVGTKPHELQEIKDLINVVEGATWWPRLFAIGKQFIQKKTPILCADKDKGRVR